MHFPEMTLQAYHETLASSAPTPGGGAATALAASQGASLVSMVCNLTVGKEKYAQYQDLMENVLPQLEKMQATCLGLMDKDAQAFDQVAAVFALPKNSEAELAHRKEKMQLALKACTLPPMELMEESLKGLELTASVLGKSNQSAVSDLGVAALFFQSAIQGAWLNVTINLGSLQDETFVQTHKTRGEEILVKGKTLAEQIYGEVLKMTANW